MNIFSKSKVLYLLLMSGLVLVLIAISSLMHGDFKEFFSFDYKQDSTESTSGLELLIIGLVLIIISIWRLIKNKETNNASR